MAEDRITRIYVLRDPRDGAVRYVGKTVQTLDMRLRAHLTHSKRRITHRDCWIASLNESGLRPEIVQIEKAGADWAERERYWISHFRGAGADLTNLTDGGDGVEGLPDEIREIIRIKRNATIESAAWRARQAEINRATMTPERLAQMSAISAAAMTPERRVAHSKKVSTTTSCPEWRAKQSITISATMTPERRAEISAKTSASMTPERRRQIAETQKQVAADPEYKANQRAAQIAARRRPGVLERIAAGVQLSWTPERRAAAAERARITMTKRHADRAALKAEALALEPKAA